MTPDERRILGGLTYAATGDLDRPLDRGLPILRPRRVWQDGNFVRWTTQPDLPGIEPERAPDNPGLLEDFLYLKNGNAEEIIAFMERNGPLDVCEHKICGHKGRPRWKHGRDCIIPRGPEQEGCLPIETWKHLSAKVVDVLDISAQLHMGQYAESKQFGKVIAGSDFDVLQSQRPLVAEIISQWLNQHVRLVLKWWEETPPTIRVQPNGLWGAIALDCALAIARSEGLAICSSCALPYAPTRRPNPKRNRYCPRCGHKAALRDAQQRQREKRRQEKKS